MEFGLNAARKANHKNAEQNQNRRRGRPVGSVARIPPGHVDINGLADYLGVSPASIPAMERRGDPIIPPRSPLAGFGKKRRAIWRIVDIQQNIESLAAARQPAAFPAPAEQTPRAQPVSSVWRLASDASSANPATTRRRPGRPRRSSKNSSN